MGTPLHHWPLLRSRNLLHEGFLSYLRTSHSNSYWKHNWKSQKAITLKAFCSESTNYLFAHEPLAPATASADGAVIPGYVHGAEHGGRLHTWEQANSFPLERIGFCLLPQTLTLSQVLWHHPTKKANKQHIASLLSQGKRMFVFVYNSITIWDVATNKRKNYILVLETPKSYVTYALWGAIKT